MQRLGGRQPLATSGFIKVFEISACSGLINCVKLNESQVVSAKITHEECSVVSEDKVSLFPEGGP